MTSLRRLACPFNAFPLAGDRLFMELRSRCAASLVDCAARGKVAESRRADMARKRFFRCALSFAYASCSSVPVARAASVVHAAVGATAPRRGEPDRMSPDATAKPPAAPIDGLPPELRRWAVAAIFTALAMASLDTAIANIALPAIAADLHVSPADVVWVVNVYQIALVATLLPLGALGEIVGHQRIYLGGLLLFTLASLGCALRMVAAQPDGGAGAAGIGRQRHHERQRGAGPLRLPDPYAGPRLRPQRAGGRNGVHARADDCLRRSFRSEHGRGCSRSIFPSA